MFSIELYEFWHLLLHINDRRGRGDCTSLANYSLHALFLKEFLFYYKNRLNGVSKNMW